MPWFDGTFDYTDEKLESEFPLKVSDDIRFSEDKSKMAIINNFPEDSDTLEASDPHSESGADGGVMFYHPVFGSDAIKVCDAIDGFIKAGYHNQYEAVTLFRRDPKRLYMYGYGHICVKTFFTLKGVFIDAERVKNLFFVIPLKRHLYNCPICGHRTLPYKDTYEICPECGWEDERIYDEDEVTGANGEYSARAYREEYLAKKAADPGYSWRGEITTGFLRRLDEDKGDDENEQNE